MNRISALNNPLEIEMPLNIYKLIQINLKLKIKYK